MNPDSFLNVEQSLGGSRWVVPPVPTDRIEALMRRHDLPEIVARLLAARNVAPEQVESFLYPTLKNAFPDPFSLAGMRELADDLSDAIIAKKPLGVFGDFDVDGATSTSILIRFFRHFGLDVPCYIPDRMAEGYGPNVNALKTLKDKGAEFVLLCDCGITAHGVLAAGREMGLTLAVLDHHEAEETLPPAQHVIDPKRKDDTSGLSMLAACGVAFMACVATNTVLREKGYYAQNGLKEPPLKDWLDIVALGTVCDMVPLIGVNRLLVRTGFARMAARENAGIRALLEVGKVKGDPTPFHAGFTLGPRINAGSRVHQADLGAKLLATDDFEEATNIAWILNDCNDKRKGIQTEMVRHAVRMVEENGYADHPIIMVGHEDWHPGLAGLVAGQLKERFGKPSVVVTFAPGQGGVGLEGRGSGRSVAGINMGAAFIDARNEGILVKGGGHAMAAGFTVMPDRVEDFRAFLLRHIGDQLNGMSVVSETMIDGILSVRGCRPDFVALINNHLGPFGIGNDEPIFVLPSVKIHKVDVVGDTHVRCMIGDAEGGGWMKAMAFRAVDTPVGDALLRGAKGGHVHLAGRLKVDDWSGTDKVEMHVTDAAPAVAVATAEERVA